MINIKDTYMYDYLENASIRELTDKEKESIEKLKELFKQNRVLISFEGLPSRLRYVNVTIK